MTRGIDAGILEKKRGRPDLPECTLSGMWRRGVTRRTTEKNYQPWIKSGLLNIISSFLPDFSVLSSNLFGIRSFLRTMHGFCMTHHQAIAKGERRSETEA